MSKLVEIFEFFEDALVLLFASFLMRLFVPVEIEWHGWYFILWALRMVISSAVDNE